MGSDAKPPHSALLSRALEGSGLPFPGGIHLDELRTSPEEEKALKALLQKGDKSHDLKCLWVVDVADESDDWFIATGYSFNDDKQTVHVMVPDSENPVWEGDIPLDCRALHLLECCDPYSTALFKQIVKDSAVEVDWEVTVASLAEQKDGGAAAVSAGVVNLFLPMGGYVVMQEAGKTGCSLVNVDSSLTLVRCGEKGGQVAEDAFFLLLEEKIAQFDSSSEWGAAFIQRKEAEMGLDGLGRHRNRQSKSELMAAAADPTRRGEVLAIAAQDAQDLMKQTLDMRDRILVRHIEMLRTLRRFLLDGDLIGGQSLLEEVEGRSLDEMEQRAYQEREQVTTRMADVQGLLDAVVAANTVDAAAGEGEGNGKEESSPARQGREAALLEERKVLQEKLDRSVLRYRELRQRVMELEGGGHGLSGSGGVASSNGKSEDGVGDVTAAAAAASAQAEAKDAKRPGDSAAEWKEDVADVDAALREGEADEEGEARSHRPSRTGWGILKSMARQEGGTFSPTKKAGLGVLGSEDEGDRNNSRGKSYFGSPFRRKR
ncbi:unnamed protein product [Chrysoparadoxa australica]